MSKKYSSWSVGGNVIRDNETYVVTDNNVLNRLVLSSTLLRPGKQTNGHSHSGQEEVYMFISGSGSMLLGDTIVPVEAGDIVPIPDGAWHQVFNESNTDDLYFVCVFDGNRV